MLEITNEEAGLVSGGLIPALIVLATVIKYEPEITEAVHGFFEGLEQSNARHQ